MCDENTLPAISHRSLPNPSKTEALPLKLQVVSHAEHKATISAERL